MSRLAATLAFLGTASTALWIPAARAFGDDVESAKPRPEVRVEIRPRGRVFRGGDYRLEVRLDPPRAARFRWSASAGELFSEDSRVVPWRAPERGDDVELRVAVTPLGSAPGAAPLEGVLRVRVESPEEIDLRSAGLVRIPGATVTIGDTWTDTSRESFILTNQNKADKPPHRVRLSTFHIGRDRVTNREYAAFLDALLEDGLVEVAEHAVLGWHRGTLVPFLRFSFRDLAHLDHIPRLRGAIRFQPPAAGAGAGAVGRFAVASGEEEYAVVDVTWAGADAYARYRGMRLPTSAQWELAARGTDGRRYPWGDELPTPLHANLNSSWGDRRFPVGSFSPLGDSPYGVHDMLGEVFEWVEDWYEESYYEDVSSAAAVVDPRGAHWGKDHVLRGVPATQGVIGAPDEQPPISFRYAWFFEFAIGNGVATRDTGFRIAAADPAAAVDGRS